MLSVNTNAGAALALEYLNQTSSDLVKTQNIVSSGLAVAGPKDNAAIYAIAQNLRAQVGGYQSVQQSLSRGASVVDVAVAAGQSVSDILTQMKQKAIAAADPSIDSNSATALNNDYQSLVNQLKTVIANANFNGVNMLDSTATGFVSGGVQAITNTDASTFATTGKITVASHDLSTLTSIAAGVDLTSTSNATAAATDIDADLQTVNSALADLGSGSTELDLQQTFVSNLVDSLNSGIGNLVDADMAKESADLQALQVKQQLGVQALSIANSAPSVLLGLFH